MDGLTIGQLADAAGVGVETVRYYERRGLLPEPPRTPAGYRQYGPDDVWRLQFVARGKALGFTLAEIADLLADGADDERVLAAASAKLAALDATIAELVATQARLRALVERCSGTAAGGAPGDCTALVHR